MSYDISLEIDAGGPEPAMLDGGGNFTSNCAPMWRKAGADLATFHGRIAGDVLPELRGAVADMEDHPLEYRPLEPSNRWGSYETCLDFLRGLVADFSRYPKATVRVSR